MVFFAIALLFAPIALFPNHESIQQELRVSPLELVAPFELAQDESAPVPLRRIGFVANDPNSYLDEFSYIAAVPTSVFTDVDTGTRYISPLILGEGSDAETWLVEDWIKYLNEDGGLTQAISIGDFTDSSILEIQELIGAKIFPRFSGATSADVAAQLAVAEWTSSATAVFALANEGFGEPLLTSSETSHTFQGSQTESETIDSEVTSTSPVSIPFSPPSSAGWLEGSCNWTSGEIFTHYIRDPNGNIVDYSVRSRVYHERLVGIPLNFWVPKTMDGEWEMIIHPPPSVSGTIPLEFEVSYHPGFTQSVTVPNGAKWLNVSITWDNAGTNLNLALIDPDGRLTQWSPTESVLASLGESVDLPYPMAGDWTILVSWIDAVQEQNNVDVSWDVSVMPSELQDYLESAANGAVLASLLNVPLLYVDADSIPEVTTWAAERLGVSTSILVDPANIHSPSLENELDDYSTFVNIGNYLMLTNMIRSLSGQNDVVISVPTGDGSEFFAPAAFSAAFHGAPILSLCGTDNSLTTRAEETWAPYLIGPEIEVYVTNTFTARAENGWYDERIPNKYSMMKSVTDFEDFLNNRGAYNATSSQSVVIVAPVDLLKISFDRSLQSHFSPGRIPARNPAMASVMIARGALHRFLYLSADSADTVLLSMYAYTDGYTYVDNFLQAHSLHQYTDSLTAFQGAGYQVESHIGFAEVFEGLDSQVALWSLSTHGTLTELPTDPPQRPGGIGVFSMRSEDSSYGMEEEGIPDSDGDTIVNPVLYDDSPYHVLKTTTDLEGAVDNIGSPIVIVTACLLGGSGFPRTLMEHGAVGVMASPRTVYFQPAGMICKLVTDSLVTGNSTGAALSYAITTISFDYSDPLGIDPRDYANQHVLFGDPEIHLYEPTSSPHVPSADPLTSSFGGHTPGRGVAEVAALGTSGYLPDTLGGLGISHDYYSTSNYSSFEMLLSMRHVVLVEPGSLSSLSSNLNASSNRLQSYVREGGVFVVLGVSGDLSWLPWPVSYDSSGSGTSVTIIDPAHPLLTIPNTLASTVDYQGHFSSAWSNLSILATDGTNPVIVAAALGTGKIALTTTTPADAERNATIQNAVSWADAPSILLRSIQKNQQIIWEGDRIIITLQLKDQLGNGIAAADVLVTLNETEVAAVDDGEGIYTVIVTEEWTTGKVGIHSFRIYARKAGYDTLSLTLTDFMLIRSSPLLLILLGAGVVIGVVVLYYYHKYRRGDEIFPRRGKGKSTRFKDKSKEEKQRQKKKDEEFDAAEFFGVE
jgi:hypothetical protein